MTPGLVQFASGAIIFPEATIKPAVEVHDAIDITPTMEVSGEWSP
jgi:hypothetical protein